MEVEGGKNLISFVALLLQIFIRKYPLVPSSVLSAVASNDHTLNSELAF